MVIGYSANNALQETNELFVLQIKHNNPIPIDKKIKMSLYENLNKKQMIHHGKIERRGGFSIKFPKHSYEIDLKEDISLAELPVDDDWILNANYIDKTFIRHVLSYELFSSMSNQNIAPKSKYVELELNGVYNGLYVLMEKLDKSSLGIVASDSMAVIFKEPKIFRKNYEKLSTNDQINFHQQTYPKINKENKTLYLEGIRKFILSTNNTDFQTSISKLLDIDNIIDWHLLLLITNNSDGILKNFYLYKKDNTTPIRIAPWDYDHSFGRDGDNELNLNERPLNIERSILFKRLLECEWYIKKLKKKWDNLNSYNILSVSGLKQRILTKKEMIKTSVQKNFKIWPIDSRLYYDANNFEQEIDIMLKFIDIRHKYLTEYFSNLKS